MRQGTQRRALSMVELLVVVLMGTILLGLLVPAPSAPAWRGKRGTTFG